MDLKRILKNMNFKGSVITLFIILFILFLFAIYKISDKSKTPIAPVPIRISLTLQPSSALLLIAYDQGFLAEAGLTVSAVEFPSGKAALHQGLFANMVDIISTSETPPCLAAFDRSDFRIIATTFSDDNTYHFIARKDCGIKTPQDLKGKNIGTMQNSAHHFFVSRFFSEHNIRSSDVKLSFYPAEQLPKALADGSIDATATREPYLSEINAMLGNNVFMFESKGIYITYDLLVTTETFIKTNPEAIRRLLSALIKTEKFIRKSPEQAAEKLGKRLKINKEKALAILKCGLPEVALSQSFVYQLETIAHWAIDNQIVSGKESPDFLKLIDTHFLNLVEPNTVTIMH